MTQRGLVCLLFAALAWGQTAKPATQAAPATPATQSSSTPSADQSKKIEATESKVAPDAPVITVPGACDKAAGEAKQSSDCKTVVTRAQFEKLMDAVAPTAPPTARRQIANRYATMLVMSKEAEKLGLDKGDHFDEMMKLMRLQVLAQTLQQHIQEQAGQIPDQDIQDYYQKNISNFEEASLNRLFIPKTKTLEPPKEKLSDAETKKRQEEAEAAMKTEADALYKRAQAGEDFGKLQEEAFQAAGMKAKAPSTSMPEMRRSSLPPAHRSVFDLKTGEISPLITDTTGYFIYKMGEKETVPVDKVKEEIHNTLRAERINQSMQDIQKSATPTLNDEYFGATGPEAEGMPGPAVKPAPKPPVTRSKSK